MKFIIIITLYITNYIFFIKDYDIEDDIIKIKQSNSNIIDIMDEILVDFNRLNTYIRDRSQELILFSDKLFINSKTSNNII